MTIKGASSNVGPPAEPPSPPRCRKTAAVGRGEILCEAGFGTERPPTPHPLQGTVHHFRSMSRCPFFPLDGSGGRLTLPTNMPRGVWKKEPSN
jgi:hypothetical protein